MNKRGKKHQIAKQTIEAKKIVYSNSPALEEGELPKLSTEWVFWGKLGPRCQIEGVIAVGVISSIVGDLCDSSTLMAAPGVGLWLVMKKSDALLVDAQSEQIKVPNTNENKNKKIKDSEINIFAVMGLDGRTTEFYFVSFF